MNTNKFKNIFIIFCSIILINSFMGCGIQYTNSDGTPNEQKVEETYELITVDFAQVVMPIVMQILNERLSTDEITRSEYDRAVAVLEVFNSQKRAIESAEIVDASFKDIIRTFASWFNLFNRTVLPLLADILQEIYPEKVIVIQSLETILKATGYLI